MSGTDQGALTSAALARAYRATRYVCRMAESEVHGDIVLRPGFAVPDVLSMSLHSRAVREAAVITASNPYSRALTDAANASRHERLLELLDEQRLDYRAASGIGDDPAWPPEHGCLVLGVSAQGAIALAEQFEQYAIVVAPADGEVAIRFTALWPD